MVLWTFNDALPGPFHFESTSVGFIHRVLIVQIHESLTGSRSDGVQL